MRPTASCSFFIIRGLVEINTIYGEGGKVHHKKRHNIDFLALRSPLFLLITPFVRALLLCF